MRLFLLFIVVLISESMFSQVVRTRISNDHTLIGSHIDLVYSIEFPKDKKFEYEPVKGNFPAKITSEKSSLTSGAFDQIEIVSFEDTIVVKGNKKTWIGVYELCPWDSGLVVLEGQKFTLNDSTGSFQSAYLKVNLVPRKKGQDLYDIKEMYVDTPEEASALLFFFKYIIWWLLPLIGFLIYRLYFKKDRAVKKSEKETSLKQKTLFAIDALEKAELWRKDKMKEHFVELSYVLRSYLTSRYDIHLMDKTTSETRLLLLAKGIEKPIVDTILKLLSHSDMVKFAASKPGEEIVERAFFEIRQLVIETSPLEYDVE